MEFVCVIALQWWRSDRGVMPILPASSMFSRDLRDCVALLLSAALLCSSLLLCLLVWLRYVVRFYLLVLCKLEGYGVREGVCWPRLVGGEWTVSCRVRLCCWAIRWR